MLPGTSRGCHADQADPPPAHTTGHQTRTCEGGEIEVGWEEGRGGRRGRDSVV